MDNKKKTWGGTRQWAGRPKTSDKKKITLAISSATFDEFKKESEATGVPIATLMARKVEE